MLALVDACLHGVLRRSHSHAALAYHYESPTNIAYDGCAETAFGYDGGETHLRNGNHRLSGKLALFGNFAKFLAAEGTAAVFGNAPTGFSNGNLAQESHNNFEPALNDLYGTISRDWAMRTAPGQTGVDATYVGPASGNPGFNFAELKPYSVHSLGTFGNRNCSGVTVQVQKCEGDTLADYGPVAAGMLGMKGWPIISW